MSSTEKCKLKKLTRNRISSFYSITDTRFTWSDMAVDSLFELWEDNLDGLRGDRKNTHIYKEISEKLKDFGPNHMEVKNKMENMVKRYRKSKIKAFMKRPIFKIQVITSISRRELGKVDPIDRLGYILEATNRVYDNPADSKCNTIIAQVVFNTF